MIYMWLILMGLEASSYNSPITETIKCQETICSYELPLLWNTLFKKTMLIHPMSGTD